MLVAARYGELWVTTGDPAREGRLGAREGAGVVRGQIARLEEACRAVGRDPATLRRLVLGDLLLESGLHSVEGFRETLGRYAEVGVTDWVVHWPRASEPFAGELEAFERVVSGASPGR
jgi:hypothetical protein